MLKLEKMYRNSSPYTVIIRHPRYGRFRSLLTAPISFRTASSWSDVMDQRNDRMVNYAAAEFRDKSTMLASFSTQVLQSIEPINLTVQFGKVAINSTRQEILDPVSDLLRWPLPPVIEKPLAPPVNPQKGMLCSLITPWLFIPNFLIPREVTTDLDATLDREENSPIKYNGTIMFQSFRIVSAAELKSWFVV